MQILGEKSLSSKVVKGLKLFFIIITLLDFLVVILTIGMAKNDNGMIRISGNTKEFIFMLGIIMVFLLTGIVSLYIIYQFIKIFKNLKNSKLFEKENSITLQKISISSIVISILYLILLLGTTIVFNEIIDFGVLSNTLIIVLCFVFFMGFLTFGIGIKILNEIYKRAILYKEENDFTI